ncbi:MAG: NYN domain-containing protein [Mobiluncus porci]|uniref:NYN domain-containing protein n=1 Tax=Mobiluncus porci TaxID=2652278 RepID=A0A7K0K2K7_9ACTO|nr:MULTISPECIES: NYN domain-containing protein [Mobiluncus]MCI6585438.1 NYN domain-containing protein [Mobiluncus sp.]MDD7541352.1 NYN domain-containing protein [Mobiluncus porci]MDY5747835.1 NYN domain-containing protein [Mobiluncus porci]MST49717.1 NYN domain-containing protein [Mobiluncus porci]
MKLQIPEEETTYLLVDGENIDATLGLSVLQRRPEPDERPRWDRVRDYVAENNPGQTKGLFFLNATAHMPMTFVQALLAMDYQPIPLASEGDEKVVDVGIQRTLEAISQRGEGHVVLVSHDGDFEPQLRTLLQNGHHVAVVGFEEFLSGELRSLEDHGLKVIDLEREIHAFNTPLPRIRVIDLQTYNPDTYI